ncbi:gliding motility lipoprotein GldD [Bacteroidota bacterium]
MIRQTKIKLVFVLVLFFISCRENYTPKPKAYFRINYPAHQYQLYHADCNFSFEYPTYAEVEPDKTRGAEPCWINVHYLPFNARLHISYKPVSGIESFYQLTEDTREMVYKHVPKADAIAETLIQTDNGIYGMLYELEGSTASALQFFVSDSIANYLRGSLYFDSRINRDSLEPVIEFLKVDIQRMISTFEWK